MRINELTPYRRDPNYKKARDIFADPESGLPPRRKSKLNQLTAWLEQHGFKNLGQGSFGAVYEKPGYPWVFKVFNRDPAYLYFLKYAMAHQSNPHLPKIRGLIKIDDNTYVVRMEKLTQIPMGSEPANSLLKQIHMMDSYGDLSDKQVEWIKNTLPGVHQFFMSFPLSGYEYDIHYENLMMRGNTIVITDPLYDWHGIEGDE